MYAITIPNMAPTVTSEKDKGEFSPFIEQCLGSIGMDHVVLVNCVIKGQFYKGIIFLYSKTCVTQPLKKKQNKDLNDKWYLNECQKYCRMLPLEHSAIL